MCAHLDPAAKNEVAGARGGREAYKGVGNGVGFLLENLTLKKWLE